MTKMTANTPTSATFHPFRQQIMEVPTYLEQREYIFSLRLTRKTVLRLKFRNIQIV
jgi:hypothetical protein